MEKGSEVTAGTYEADFRLLDSRLGRWLTPDPVKKHWESPYTSFHNNPVYWTDPSGLDPGTDDDTKSKLKGGASAGVEDLGEYYDGGKSTTLEELEIVTSQGAALTRYGRRRGGNDNPITLNFTGQTSNPITENLRTTIPFFGKYGTHFGQGFTNRLMSNLTLGATEFTSPVYPEGLEPEEKLSRASGALAADFFTFWVLGNLGAGATFLGSPAAAIVITPYMMLVAGKTGAAISTDTKAIAEAVMAMKAYNNNSDEGEHTENASGSGGGSKVSESGEFDDVLEGATHEKTSTSQIFSKNGGLTQAESDFNSKVTNIVRNEEGLKIGKDANGNTFILRNKSSDGRLTLEIQPKQGKVIKIRY